MKRPSVDASLKPLKPFQRRTVDHGFHRLFEAEDSTGRFLVADEVGLGKTLVARGIIARAIDHLWNDVPRIDIIYICSNGSIARANLPKLQIGGTGERSFALATRLTMLATQLAPREGQPGLADSKLNFVSFTPGTSFNMGHSSGQGQGTGGAVPPARSVDQPAHSALMNFTAGMDCQQGGLAQTVARRRRPIDNDIPEALRSRLQLSGRDLRHRTARGLGHVCFSHYRQHWPLEARFKPRIR